MLKFVVHPAGQKNHEQFIQGTTSFSTQHRIEQNSYISIFARQEHENDIKTSGNILAKMRTTPEFGKNNGAASGTGVLETKRANQENNSQQHHARKMIRSISVGAAGMDIISEKDELSFGSLIFDSAARRPSDMGYWSIDANSRRSSLQTSDDGINEPDVDQHLNDNNYDSCIKMANGYCGEKRHAEQRRLAWSRDRSHTITEGMLNNSLSKNVSAVLHSKIATQVPRKPSHVKQMKHGKESQMKLQRSKKLSKSMDLSPFHKSTIGLLDKSTINPSQRKISTDSILQNESGLRQRSRSVDGILEEIRAENLQNQRRERKNSAIQKLMHNVGSFFHKSKRSLSESTISLRPQNFRNNGHEHHLHSYVSDADYSSDYETDDAIFSDSSLAMQKAKPPSTTHKLLSKKWRSSKSSKLSNGSSSNLWSPEGCSVWCHNEGRKVVLGNTTLLNLSDVERLALQKIALCKLQAMNLGCSISIPKESVAPKRHKRSAFSLRRYRSNSSNSGNIGNFILDLRDRRVKEKGHGGKVFGIPISRCIFNDQETRRRRSGLIERRGSLDFPPRRIRKSSCSSTSSIENLRAPLDDSTQAVTSSESLSGSEQGSAYLEIPSSIHSSPSKDRSHHVLDYRPSLTPACPQVPNIINTCLKHLETYGLHVLGIFRVGSSKKRTKALRDEFDTGSDVKLNEEHNPHDVAALLKEFFRDLPEPLLSRELYNAFIATRKLKDQEKQQSALRLLLALLPVPNRDTLWALVKFLNKVSEHSNTSFDATGVELPGNKMDSHNLATVFGPNILHKAKGGAGQDFQVESLERAEERKEIISCIEDLINQHTTIFQVPAELHDDILKNLRDTKPDAVDYLLKQLTQNYQICIEIDPDSSDGLVDKDVHNQQDHQQPFRRGLRRVGTFNGPEKENAHRALRQTVSNDGSIPPEKDYLRVPVRRTARSRLSANIKNIYRKSAPEGSLSPEEQFGSQETLAAPQDTQSPTVSSRSLSSQSLEVSNNPIHKTPENSSETRRRRHFRDKRSPNMTINIAEELSGSTSSGYSSQRSPSMNKDLTSSTSSLSSYNPGSSRNSLSLSPARPAVEIHRWSLCPPPNANAKSNPNSPKICSRDYKYATSSLTRPLGIRVVDNTSPDESVVGSVEWQKDRWRRWQMISKNVDDSHEQETLV